MTLSKVQCYSLVSRFSTVGVIESVVKSICEHHAELVVDAERFLDVYNQYCDYEKFPRGGGAIDGNAYTKTLKRYFNGGLQ